MRPTSRRTGASTSGVIREWVAWVRISAPLTPTSVPFVNLLLTYPDPSARLGEVLLDQRVMCGVGNVYRCEVLWATELSPYAKVGSISEHEAIRLVNAAATMLRANLHHAKRVTASGVKGGLAVYGRNGQRCGRCGGTVECRRMGDNNRVLYWCPGCQTHLDPKLERSSDDTPMDPHPAAQRWLADLPWNRDASLTVTSGVRPQM